MKVLVIYGKWYLDKERNKIVLLDDKLNFLKEYENEGIE